MELILLTCENNRTSSVVWISALFDIDSSASRPTISQARANSVLNSENGPPQSDAYPAVSIRALRVSGVAQLSPGTELSMQLAQTSIKLASPAETRGLCWRQDPRFLPSRCQLRHIHTNRSSHLAALVRSTPFLPPIRGTCRRQKACSENGP